MATVCYILILCALSCAAVTAAKTDNIDEYLQWKRERLDDKSLDSLLGLGFGKRAYYGESLDTLTGVGFGKRNDATALNKRYFGPLPQLRFRRALDTLSGLGFGKKSGPAIEPSDAQARLLLRRLGQQRLRGQYNF